MSLLAPAFLVVAGIVAGGAVALHFLSTREPDTDLLPTVRFMPELPLRATTVTVRFSDARLLALRVLTVLLLGVALARPVVVNPFSQPVARIVAVDASRAVASATELVDSAHAYVEGAAALVLFGNEAREVEEGWADSLEALRDEARWSRAAKGSLSGALIASLRVASRLRNRADSVQLVVVSPFAREERDAATGDIRALWPGRIDVVRAAAAGTTGGIASDAPNPGGRPSSRRPLPRLVEWADSGATGLWMERQPPDTVGAVRVADAVMIYPFTRRWRPSPEVNARPWTHSSPDTGGATRVYARWLDGEPAGFERETPGGCTRSIAVTLPSEGDAILRTDFRRFLAGLGGPCGEAGDGSPLPDTFVTAFQGSESLAPTSRIEPPVQRTTPAVPWLLGLALLVALWELWLRRRMADKGGRHGEGPTP